MHPLPKDLSFHYLACCAAGIPLMQESFSLLIWGFIHQAEPDFEAAEEVLESMMQTELRWDCREAWVSAPPAISKQCIMTLACSSQSVVPLACCTGLRATHQRHWDCRQVWVNTLLGTALVNMSPLKLTACCLHPAQLLSNKSDGSLKGSAARFWLISSNSALPASVGDTAACSLSPSGTLQ